MSRYDFDLAVLGGGAAGLTAAGIAANAGVKTLLAERHRLGGDCTWTGCIPSKSLLHHAAQAAGESETTGVKPAESVDFTAVMQSVRETREEVYRDADAPEIFEGFGIDVVQGDACFTDSHTVRVALGDGGERQVTARQFVIASGGRPSVPPIEGIERVDYHTSDTLFELSKQPSRLMVIGGGPIGVEMAQAFSRLGSSVTLVDQSDRLLGHDDEDHASILLSALRAEGIRFVLDAEVERAEQTDSGTVRLHVRQYGESMVVEGDALLLATGRRPNTEGLGLEAAGVTVTKKGIQVDERCRTSQRHIWAAGDCTGEYQLTHMSEHMAKVATTNAILKVPMSIDRDHVPWCTYTSPEVAQLGPTERELRDKGTSFELYRFPYSKIDRALTDDAAVGQIKVMATRWSGAVLGVSAVGALAGEIIGLYAVAMRNGVSLRQLSDTIFPYPTYVLGARRAADQWYVRKQFPAAIRTLQSLFGYRGTVPPPPSPDRIV